MGIEHHSLVASAALLVCAAAWAAFLARKGTRGGVLVAIANVALTGGLVAWTILFVFSAFYDDASPPTLVIHGSQAAFLGWFAWLHRWQGAETEEHVRSAFHFLALMFGLSFAAAAPLAIARWLWKVGHPMWDLTRTLRRLPKARRSGRGADDHCKDDVATPDPRARASQARRIRGSRPG